MRCANSFISPTLHLSRLSTPIPSERGRVSMEREWQAENVMGARLCEEEADLYPLPPTAEGREWEDAFIKEAVRRKGERKEKEKARV